MKKYIARLVAVSTVVLVPGLAVAAGFPDVPASHPNAEAIAYVQAQDIVTGYPDGSYRPEQTINRAEFVKILIESHYAGSNGPGPAECLQDPYIFPDVPSSVWYAAYACVALNKGYIKGYSNGYFYGERGINFVEAAKILSLFSDLPISQTSTWYEGYVRAIEKKNAIPFSIASFDHKITRGEMAEMIYRLKAGVVINKPSRTYEELVSKQQPVSWKSYVNIEQKIRFSYPSTYAIVTDKVVNRYSDNSVWYRIELEDRSSAQRPHVIVEVNPDGYGPFFADKRYVLRETADGSVEIVSSEETIYSEENTRGLGFDPHADGTMLIIPGSIEAMNGNLYSMRFSFREDAMNPEPVFRQILESMHFGKPDDTNTPTMKYRSPQGRFTLQLPEGTTINNDEKRLDLPFESGIPIIKKYLTIIEGGNHISCIGDSENTFPMESSEEVTISGIHYKKEVGSIPIMNALYPRAEPIDFVRYTTLYPTYSGSICTSFTFALKYFYQGSPPPSLDDILRLESAVFEEIMESVLFD